MAVITVDLDNALATVDRRILGGFAEHLGRCIYGGIYDEGSPLSDERGFRKDVVEAVRRLKPPVLRWPGGNFVSGYHWTDGIGPRDARPRRMELAWHGEEPNRFGTDDFMAFCQAVGAEPYICLNMGTGTMDEAQAWVEYCNGQGRTEWAERRRSNGHEQPYRARYWGLGNEMWGPWQIGQLSAHDYVKKARQWAKVLKWTDPDIELVSCGETGWSDWDEITIAGLAEFVRWHSVHIYTGSDDYWTNVLTPHQTERALRIAGALIEKARYNQKLSHPVHVAYDEWNVWFRERTAGLEERYNLGDALAVATYLHAFVRHAHIVKMANLAQLVNVIAPIVTNENGLFLQTIYHPLRFFADYLGAQSVYVHVESERHEFTDLPASEAQPHRVGDLGPFPVLDVVATTGSLPRQLMVSVVNRSPDQEVTAELRLRPWSGPVTARVEELNGPDWESSNSFERPDLVSPRTTEVDKFDSGSTHRFPAHSHTIISVPLN